MEESPKRRPKRSLSLVVSPPNSPRTRRWKYRGTLPEDDDDEELLYFFDESPQEEQEKKIRMAIAELDITSNNKKCKKQIVVNE